MKFLSSIVRHSLQLSKKPTISGFPANPAKTFTHPINQQNNSSSKDLADSPTPFKTSSTVNETIETTKQKKQLVTDSSNNIEANNNEHPLRSTTAPTNTRIKVSINNRPHENKTTVIESPTTLLDSQDEVRSQNHSTKANRVKVETDKQAIQKTTKQHKQTNLKTDTTKPIKPSQSTYENKRILTTTNENKTKHENTLPSAEQKNKSINSHSESVTLNNIQKDTTKTKKQARNSYYITRQKPAKQSLLKTTKQTKTVQQTPQVRIGQINVLIEDQAKTTSKPKPTINTQTSSPFGYRGL